MAEITVSTANIRVTHNKEENLKHYFDVIDEAGRRGSKLIVFPECALQGYLFGIGHTFSRAEWEYHFGNAETVPGPSTDRLIEKARAHDMTIVIGMTEKVKVHGGWVLANSSVTLGPEGVYGSYQKVHCALGEKFAFRPGRQWNVYQTSVGNVGTAIWYDIMFPESVRELVLRGAEIVAFSTVWPVANIEGYHEQELSIYKEMFCRIRALENQILLISSSICETDNMSDLLPSTAGWQRRPPFGHSLIVSPTGEVLAQAGNTEELLTVTADVEKEIMKARTVGFNGLHFLKDRRPETYSELTSTYQS